MTVTVVAVVGMLVLVPGRLTTVLEEVDEAHASSQADQLAFVTQAEFDRLEAAAIDWGASDDMRAFVLGAQPDYVEDNLATGTLPILRVDAIAIVGEDGTVHAQFEDDEGMLVPPSPGFQHIAAEAPGLELGSPDTSTSGVAVIDGEPWAIGAAAITDSHHSRAPVGVLVWGDRLDDELAGGWAAGLPNPPSLTSAPAPGRPVVDGDLLRGGIALPTLIGESQTLSFAVPRAALTMGGPTVMTSRWVLIVTGVLAAVLFATWLDRYLVRRLTKLEQEVDRIGPDADARVTVSGDDELAHLAMRVNALLARLEQAHRDLATRNAELVEANRATDGFISMLSHEFRTPLTAILGFTDTLQSRWDEVDDGTRRRMLHRVHVQAETLNGLVTDLLALRKAQDPTAQLTTPGEPTPLDAAVAEAVDGLPSPIAEHVQLDLDAGDRHVPLSAEWLRRVATNLLGNAHKYGRPPFVVRTAAVDDDVELVVTDHGDGVPEAFVDQLFEPFAQGDQLHDQTGARGVGLGLSIVHAIVVSTGGTVTYTTGDQGGARFVVRLPGAEGVATGEDGADN